ncbi:MAG: response regulator [Maricaulaceae bacterium]
MAETGDATDELNRDAREASQNAATASDGRGVEPSASEDRPDDRFAETELETAWVDAGDAADPDAEAETALTASALLADLGGEDVSDGPLIDPAQVQTTSDPPSEIAETRSALDDVFDPVAEAPPAQNEAEPALDRPSGLRAWMKAAATRAEAEPGRGAPAKSAPILAAKTSRSRRQSWVWLGAASAVLGVFGAVIAVIAPAAAGAHGRALLGGVALTGVFVLGAHAMSGRWSDQLDPSAERGASSLRRMAAAFEVSSLPMLVCDAQGAPRMANAAYRRLAIQAGRMGQSSRPPGVDRLFGAKSGSAPALFRLARAAKQGFDQEETFANVDFGEGARSFAVGVSPLQEGWSVWRIAPQSAPQTQPDPGAETGDAVAALDAEALVDRAPVGFFAAGPNGRVIYANATLRNWLGLAETGWYLRVKDFVQGEAARAILRPPREKGEAVRIEAVLKARNGVETQGVMVASWPDGEDKSLARVVVFGSHRSGAPPGLAVAAPASRSAGYGRGLDDLFAAAPFGIARLDGDNPNLALIEDANPAFIEMTEGAGAPGRAFAEMFADPPQAAFSAVAERGGGSEPIEARLGRTEGREEASGEPRGRPVYVYFAEARGGRRVAYVIDLTAQRELESQLVQAQKMQAVGLLAGGLAHEMNNMLTVVQLNMGELLRRHPIGDPSYAELQEINQTSSRAAGLVRQMLAFSRQQTFRPDVLDVAALFSEFSHFLRQILEETIALEITHGRDLPLIRADKGQLETAILNLATNARDAMREKGGGALRIHTSRARWDAVEELAPPEAKAGDYLRIQVADTGCGMDAATMEKVFEPFFTTKDVGKGTGLGLAMVHGIISQSGGFVRPSSVVGEGTTFDILLPEHVGQPGAEPVKPRPKPAKPARKILADHAGRGRILLVEDEDAVRKIAAKTLAMKGYEVLEAEDGEAALEIARARAGEIDLMISDVVMPGMNGPTLLKEARAYLGDARVVFISGYAEEQFSDLLAEEQDVSFLPKPFTLPQLAACVKEQLGR